MTKQQIKDSLAKTKPELKVCDFIYTQIGTDEIGLPVYRVDYSNTPTNYKLVRVIEDLKIAILEDLDYVPPAS